MPRSANRGLKRNPNQVQSPPDQQVSFLTLAGLWEADRAYLTLVVTGRNNGQLRDASMLQAIIANLQHRLNEANHVAGPSLATYAQVGFPPITPERKLWLKIEP